MNLAASGILDPASGISGIADYDGNVTSDGHEAKTSGKLTATNLQVVQKGSPAGKPVQVTYTVMHDLAKQTGTIPQCEIAMGKAVAHMTGTYDAHGKVTAVNLKLNGQGMPVDDLEAMLPARRCDITSEGNPERRHPQDDHGRSPVRLTSWLRSVPCELENSTLANFNLGSKLSAISALSGKSTGNDTTIQNFSSDVRVAPEGTKADNINLTVPAIGVVTGAGTVSPGQRTRLQNERRRRRHGDIPFAVSGTTSDPKFVPDVKGIATGLLKGALSGKGNTSQQNPVNSVMGHVQKKKPQ